MDTVSQKNLPLIPGDFDKEWHGASTLPRTKGRKLPQLPSDRTKAPSSEAPGSAASVASPLKKRKMFGEIHVSLPGEKT